MSGAPARFTELSDGRLVDRVARLDARLDDLQTRLESLQLEEERLRAAEKSLLDASARRIHEFERRLEHEWLALRQLHEEPLKTLNQRTASTVETCLNVVHDALALLRERARATDEEPSAAVERPQRRTTGLQRASFIVLFAAVGVLGFLHYVARTELDEIRARAAAAEARTNEVERRTAKQIQDSEQTVQRLSGEALTTAGRAERLANILAAPDVRAHTLRGQRSSAAAEGIVLFSASRGVALTASRLSPLPADRVYQVWVTTTRGPISLGFASPDALGRASAAFDVPSELAGTIIGFMMSLEPTGGSPTPTAPIVLAS